MSNRAPNSDFVIVSDLVPGVIQEIRYHSTYNFIGDRIDGYEEPVAILTKDAARALRSASNELMVKGYRMKIFDAYRPSSAVKHTVALICGQTSFTASATFWKRLS